MAAGGGQIQNPVSSPKIQLHLQKHSFKLNWNFPLNHLQQTSHVGEIMLKLLNPCSFRATNKAGA